MRLAHVTATRFSTSAWLTPRRERTPDRRHDLLGEKLHRSALDRAIGAVEIHPGDEHGPERPDLLTEGDELLDHGLRAAGDSYATDYRVGGD